MSKTPEERVKEFLNTHRVGNYQALVKLLREAIQDTARRCIEIADALADREIEIGEHGGGQIRMQACVAAEAASHVAEEIAEEFGVSGQGEKK